MRWNEAAWNGLYMNGFMGYLRMKNIVKRGAIEVSLCVLRSHYKN